MGLRAQIVYLVRADRFQYTPQRRRVGEVAVVEEQSSRGVVLVATQVIDSPGIERRRPPDDPMHQVPLREQELGQI